jgi:hypothetical protein
MRGNRSYNRRGVGSDGRLQLHFPNNHTPAFLDRRFCDQILFIIIVEVFLNGLPAW